MIQFSIFTVAELSLQCSAASYERGRAEGEICLSVYLYSAAQGQIALSSS
jgi:hypothetical protein